MKKASENLKTGLIALVLGGFAVAFAFYANGFCMATGLSNDGWGLTIAILCSALAFCVGGFWTSVLSFQDYVKGKKQGAESVIGLLVGIVGVIASGIASFVIGSNLVLLFIF